ncbi:MAG: peroxiredoxin [Novosphingobium sp.]|nr:peroxiredoxin [Novosphingobium sp.]
MNKALFAAAALALTVFPLTANAELAQGAHAPYFSTQGAKAGKPFQFDLRQALRRGPVVLYFYPKAFTQGCTLEAHAFAEASDQFTAAGATVVGMSNDDLPTLQRFSTEACRDKFAVAVATPQIIRQYDVALKLPPRYAARAATMGDATNRTSYVIAQDGTVRFVHSDMDYRDHVRLTLDAVKALRTRRR